MQKAWFSSLTHSPIDYDEARAQQGVPDRRRILAHGWAASRNATGCGGSVFKGRRRFEDLQPSIDETGRWLTSPNTHARSDAERRRMERRGHANPARRAEDAERNQHRRALLLSFLSTLSRDDLLLWIDRLWLGHATEPQLDALVASVRESPHFADRIASSRTSVRARMAEPVPGSAPNNAWLNAEWRNLSEQLTVLASLRRQHHAADNQKRHGGQKSSQYRDAGVASPIGARVLAVGLFDEFFDRLELTPEAMAARLLEREVRNQLRPLETTERSRRGLGSFTAAAAAVTALALFPRWRNLYRGPGDRSPAPPTETPRR
jgi:hypothetical protein